MTPGRNIWHAEGVNNPVSPDSASQPTQQASDPQQQRLAELESLVGNWLPLPDVAELLGIPVTKVHTLISEGSLVAVRIGQPKIRVIPAEFLLEGEVLESLRGTLSVLTDAGFDEISALLWLFSEDPSLPGRPIDALRQGRKTEIRRRAQALAW